MKFLTNSSVECATTSIGAAGASKIEYIHTISISILIYYINNYLQYYDNDEIRTTTNNYIQLLIAGKL